MDGSTENTKVWIREPAEGSMGAKKPSAARFGGDTWGFLEKPQVLERHFLQKGTKKYVKMELVPSKGLGPEVAWRVFHAKSQHQETYS